MNVSYSVTIDLEHNDSYHFLTKLRSSHGRDTPAHVTVILNVSSSEFSVLRKRLASIAGRISPFDLYFSDEIKLLPPSSPHSRTCILVPVEGQYLQDIWDEVYPQRASAWQRLFGTYKPYEPHITIAYPSRDSQIVHRLVKANYLKYKRNHGGRLEGRALGLQLWSCAIDGGKGGWKPVETFKFPGFFKRIINKFRRFCEQVIHVVSLIAVSLICIIVLVSLAETRVPATNGRGRITS